MILGNTCVPSMIDDLGYGDGWCRGESQNTYVTSEGLPVLGRVSIDFVILGTDKDEVCIMNDAKVATRYFGTISYEMTTALSTEIPKILI